MGEKCPKCGAAKKSDGFVYVAFACGSVQRPGKAEVECGYQCLRNQIELRYQEYAGATEINISLRKGNHDLDLELTQAKARIKVLEAVVDKLPKLVQGICERRELKPCWYDDDADCGNWPTCQVGCELNELRRLIGWLPQEDGGIDRQPPAATEQEANPNSQVTNHQSLDTENPNSQVTNHQCKEEADHG